MKLSTGPALLVSSIVLAAPGLLHDHDPVVEDPAGRDAEFPAVLVEAPPGLSSHGKRLNGILYLAAGEGPHPTVVLLHGLPGNERNTDLAHALRRGGWNVAFFHYRGAWGSEGDFSFVHCVEDVGAMVAFLRDDDSRETYRVDPQRIVLVGHSMGGGTALVAGALDPGIAGVVSLAGADLAVLGELQAEVLDGFGAHLEEILSLRVPDGRAILEEIGEAPFDLRPAAHAAVLAERALLFVTGEHDEAVDPAVHQAPLIAALERAGAEDVTEVSLAADHAFSSRRIELARTVLAWLDERFDE